MNEILREDPRTKIYALDRISLDVRMSAIFSGILKWMLLVPQQIVLAPLNWSGFRSNASALPNYPSGVRDFLKWSEQQHKAHPRTYRRYVFSSRALLRNFKDVSVDRITPADVEKFKAKRAVQKGERTGRTVRPATVNRELAV